MLSGMPKPLTPEDRTFLHENFARYGEAWRPGFEMLERHFVVEAERRWRTYELGLTTRDVFGLRFSLTVGRKRGWMRSSLPTPPEGPELSPGERARVDGILAEAAELWLLEPLNSVCARIDLGSGLEGLRAGRGLSTRRVGGRALLFLTEAEIGGDLFCVGVDLEGRALEALGWWNLPPPRQGAWLRPPEVEFIDRHLKANGDFGVYGSVTMGLRALAEGFELKIRDRDGRYDFSVVPRDGHGHFLHFAMDKTTGVIGAAAAGHMEPRPRPEE
jgi:hypothetical protein